MDNYSKYIYKSRYARYLEEENRRETWSETVDRYINFFKQRNTKADIPWDALRAAIYNFEVMPSMRALMTARTSQVIIAHMLRWIINAVLMKYYIFLCVELV
jgi:hypothetical protein